MIAQVKLTDCWRRRRRRRRRWKLLGAPPPPVKRRPNAAADPQVIGAQLYWEPLLHARISGTTYYTRRVMGDFVTNFVAMATGLAVVEFVWHSIAGPRTTRTRCKNLGDICYTCWVIAVYVWNFVSMATRVGTLKIWLTSYKYTYTIPCPQEPPIRHKHLGDICYTRRVIGDFVLHFVAMATGWSSITRTVSQAAR